jgi:succinoglycan biosynthesis protein ExoA
MSSDNLPFVSVVMPVRNEAAFIVQTLKGLLAQDYPVDCMEIIVADGMSDDKTREILGEYVRRYPFVKMLDNPGRIVSFGLNAAIANAQGQIIVRIDGHCEVAQDFLRQNVKLLADHPEAWSVGGPIVHAGRTTFGKAVAIAMSHPCGVGLATHRFPDYEGYVEGAQFPAFRRWVFDRVGSFDEQLVRNQDDELNYRITQAGGKIYVSPKVRYIYFVRERIEQLFRQYFQYAFWRIPVIRKHRRPTTMRQVIPPLFFLIMLLLLMAGFALHQPLVAIALPVLYVMVLLAVGLRFVPKAGLKVASLLPVAIATMHVAYALGITYGLCAALYWPQSWDHRGAMARLSR